MEQTNNRTRPVCGKHEFDEDFYDDICPVCGWQRDSLQEKNPDYENGENFMSLNEAREAYKRGEMVI